jgi:hypothetical protein
MLEFKKYLESVKIDINHEIDKLKRNKKNIKSGVFSTLFKRGACGGKSCSRRQPGEVGWSDDQDELEVNKENYKLIKLSPEVSPGSKCYYLTKDEEEFIILEVPINEKNFIEQANLKNYNFYIEKNKIKIFLQINKNLNSKISYNKHTKFKNKIIIEYKIVDTVA